MNTINQIKDIGACEPQHFPRRGRHLTIFPHLGVGDAIICCGLVRVLSEKWDIVWPCKRHNFESVKFMWSDLPNVIVVPINGDSDLQELEKVYKSPNVLKLGLHSKEGCDFKQWDKQFYDQAGVPFEARWKRFFVPSSICALPGYDSCFVHEDKERGYLIDRKLLPHMRLSEAKKNTAVIFDWIMPIINAVEIHCIESSLALIADSLPDLFSKNPRLVLHRYARPNTHLPTYKRNWEIIN